ncbi:MAG: hypothetical protein IH877_08060 [Gemmatimonadetes bacterium]|nr:hypothetical protein [Gemmatimonadota bacterium]
MAWLSDSERDELNKKYAYTFGLLKVGFTGAISDELMYNVPVIDLVPNDTGWSGTFQGSDTTITIQLDRSGNVTIQLNDNTFTGTYSGGGLICVLRGDTILDRSTSGTIVNGTVGDDGWLCIKECGIEVSFGFDTMNARQTGLLSGSLGNRTSMSGTANWRADLGVADVGISPLRGPWEAVR